MLQLIKKYWSAALLMGALATQAQTPCTVNVSTTPTKCSYSLDGSAIVSWYDANGQLNGTGSVNPTGCGIVPAPTFTCNSAGYTRTVSNTSGSISTTGTETVLVTTNTVFNGTLNVGGGKLVICGKVTASSVTFNNAFEIIVLAGGELTLPSLNLNSNQSLKNWGKVTVNGNPSVSGTVTNYNNFITNGIFNLNATTGQLNNVAGTFYIRDIFNNLNTTLNTSTFNVGGDLNSNSPSGFTNKCQLTVGGNLNINKNFSNEGFIGVTNATTLGGSSLLTLKPNSKMETKTYMGNAPARNTGTVCALLKVTQSGGTTLNSGGTIDGKISLCTVTPLSSTTNLINGAVNNCSCNPASNAVVFNWGNSSITGATYTGLGKTPSPATVTVTIPGCPNPVAKTYSITGPNPIVIGFSENQGVLTANATGGTSPFTYSWKNGPTGPTRTVMAGQRYTVTATDSKSCTQKDSIIATTSNSAICKVNVTTTKPSCWNTTDGTATVTWIDANGNTGGGGTVNTGTPILPTPTTCAAPATPAESCTSGCTQTIAVDQNNVVVATGQKVCITAGLYTGGIQLNGGKLVICGEVIPSQMNFGPDTYELTVMSNGKLDFSNLNLSATSTLKNYGEIKTRSIGLLASISNYGKLNVDGDLNINTSGQLYNGGTIDVSASYQNLNVTLNEGIFKVGTNFHNNSASGFINKCTLTIGGTLTNDQTFYNYGNTIVTGETFNNSPTLSKISTYPSSVFLTHDFTSNAVVKAEGTTCSLFKTSERTTLNGTASLQGPLVYCDPNGLETNSATIQPSVTMGCKCGTIDLGTPTVATNITWGTEGTPTGNSLTNLPPGTYTVTVNIPGCGNVTKEYTIEAPSRMIATFTLVNNQLTVNVVYGTPALGANPYTYVWVDNTNLLSKTRNVEPGKSYSVIVTDGKGCKETFVYSPTVDPKCLSFDIKVTEAGCNGATLATAGAIEIRNGSGSYDYSWSSDLTKNSSTVEIAQAGTYTLTVLDKINTTCTGKKDFIIKGERSLTLSVQKSPYNMYTVTATGGSGAYDFVWGDGITEKNVRLSTRIKLLAGNISLTVNDLGGCGSEGLIIEVPVTPLCSLKVAPTLIQPVCYGKAEGSITLAVTDGSGSYLYNWTSTNKNPVVAEANATLLGEGSYYATVIDTKAPECTVSTAKMELTYPAKLQMTAVAGASNTVTIGCNKGTSTIKVNGVVTTNTVVTVTNVAKEVCVTDACGAVVCSTFVNCTTAVPVTLTTKDETIKGFNDGTITVTAPAQNASYELNWSGLSTSNVNQYALSSLSPGTYTVNVLDATTKVCVGKASATVKEGIKIITKGPEVQPPTPTCKSPNKLFSGTTELSGVGADPTKLKITLNGITATLGTFVNGKVDWTVCMEGCPILLKVWYDGKEVSSSTATCPTPCEKVILSVSDVSCAGKVDGKASVLPENSTAALTYVWTWPTSNTSTQSTVSGLAANTTLHLEVKQTNSDACKLNLQTTVGTNTGPLFTVSHYVENNEAFITASNYQGDYTVTWPSPLIPGVAKSQKNLTNGQVYAITVSDGRSCPQTYNFVYRNCADFVPTVKVQGNTVSILAANSGGATGTTPTYEWYTSTGVKLDQYKNQSVATLPKDIYKIVVQKGECRVTLSAPVTVDPSCVSFSVKTTEVGCGSTTATAEIVGTKPSFTYSWSINGKTTAGIDQVPAGIYHTVTVRDNSKTPVCESTKRFFIVGKPVLNVSFQKVDNNVKLVANGGKGPYVYAWYKDGKLDVTESTGSRSGLVNGEYKVEVTDQNSSCNTNVVFTIGKPVDPNCTMTVTPDVRQPSTFDGNDGQIILTVSNGSGEYTYDWVGTGSQQNTPHVTSLYKGDYSVTVTDNKDKGCVKKLNFTLIAPNKPCLTKIPTGGTACTYQLSANCNGLATAQLYVNDQLVAGGSTTLTFTGVPTKVCVQDPNNGSRVCETVICPECPTNTDLVDATSQNVTIYGAKNGWIELSKPAAQTGNYKIVWDGFSDTKEYQRRVDNLAPGTYTAKVLDQTTNTCLGQVSKTIVEPLKPIKEGPEVTPCTSGTGDQVRYLVTVSDLYLRTGLTATIAGASATVTPLENDRIEVKACVSACPKVLNVLYNGVSIFSSNDPCEPKNNCEEAVSVWHTDVTCPGDANGTAGVLPAGYSYGYYWNKGNDRYNQTTNGLSKGFVSVNVTNYSVTPNPVCSVSVEIKEPAPIVVQQFYKGIDVLLRVKGGTPPYSFKWSDLSAETTDSIRSGATLTVGQSYTVTVFDKDKKCPTVYSFIYKRDCVSPDFDAKASVTNSDVYIQILGTTTGTESYVWSHDKTYTKSFAVNLPKATYTITVSKGACMKEVKASVPNCGITVASPSNTDASCPGICDATASITLPVGYSATWSNGNTGPSATEVCGGQQFVTLINPQFPDCQHKFDFKVGYLQTICPVRSCDDFSIEQGLVVPKVCFNGSNSLIELKVNGGKGEIFFEWKDNADKVLFISSDSKYPNPSPGIYKIKATDARKCTSNVNITLTGPASQLKASLTKPTKTSCVGASDAKIILAVEGGLKKTSTLGYDLVWSDNAIQSFTRDNLKGGSISVKVTDGAGCTVEASETVSSEDISLEIYSSQSGVCKTLQQSIQLFVESPGTGYTYAWSRLKPTETALGTTVGITVSDSGQYKVVVSKTGCLPRTFLRTIPLDTNCGKKSVLCDPITVPYIEVDAQEICQAQVKKIAFEKARQRFATLQEIARKAFRDAYIDTCLKAQEKLTMNYNVRDYHFTLYYYDQTGNLVRTVPPSGTENALLTKAEIETVKSDLKSTGTTRKFTNYTFETNYTYTSLNQVLTQDMPDHLRQKRWMVEQPAGTDQIAATEAIQDVEYTSNQNAFALSTDNTNGFIYNSIDGGNTWKKNDAIGFPDLFHAASLETVQIAVGARGGVVVKTPGTVNWKFVGTSDPNSLVFAHVWKNGAAFQMVAINSAGKVYVGNDVTTGSPAFAAPISVPVLPATANATDFYANGPLVTALVTEGGTQAVYLLDLSVTSPAWTKKALTITPETGVAALAGTELVHVTADGTKAYYSTNGNQALLGQQYKALNITYPAAATAADKPGASDKITKAFWMENKSLWFLTQNGNAFVTDKTNTTTDYLLRNVKRVPTGVTFKDMDVRNNRAAAISNAGTSLAVYRYDNNAWTALSGYTYTTGDQPKSVSIGSGDNVTAVISSGTAQDLYFSNGSSTALSKVNAVRGTAGIVVEDKPLNITFAHLLSTTQGFALAGVSADQQDLYRIKESQRPDATNAQVNITYYRWEKYATTSTFARYYVETESRAYLLANDGKVWRTTDGGSSWNVEYNQDILTQTGLNVAGNLGRFIVRKSDTGTGYQYLLSNSSTDGGLHTVGDGFTRTFPNGQLPLPALEDLAIRTAGNGHLTGPNGTAIEFNNAFKLTWLPTRETLGLNDVSYSDASNTIAVADNGKVYTVAAATPGTFTPVATAGALATNTDPLQQIANYNGLAKGVYTPGTGAIKAFELSTGLAITGFPAQTRTNALTGTATGYLAVGNQGSIYTSGTLATQLITSPAPQVQPVNAAALSADGKTAIAVGNKDQILVSSDAGLSWLTVNSGASNNLRDVTFVSPNMALVFGQNGGFLYNTTTLVRQPLTNTTTIADATSIALNHRNGSTYVALGTVLYKLNGTSLDNQSLAATLTGSNQIRAIWQTTGADEVFLAGDNGLQLKLGQNPRNSNTVEWHAQLKNASATVLADKQWTIQTLNKLYFTDRITGYAVGNAGKVLKTLNGGVTWIDDRNLNAGTTTYSNNLTQLAPRPFSNELYVGGTTAASTRKLDDQADRYGTRHWYDQTGRMILTQNSRQFNKKKDPTKVPPFGSATATNTLADEGSAYSYSVYDEFNRIKEAGEVYVAPGKEITSSSYAGKDAFLAYATFETWLAEGQRSEVTTTQYDEALNFTTLGTSAPLNQKNLRNRVASSTYTDIIPRTTGSGAYDRATHYCYDIHGNVEDLVQEIKTGTNTYLRKAMHYDYDLISGKVNQVAYQAGAPDAHFHQYSYDADNRITEVKTGQDPLRTETDAIYRYNSHGPLARMTLGKRAVQTQNYAYTIQGWIKDVKGEDFEYALGYHTNDYVPIGGTTTRNSQLATPTGSSLYNGNIATMATQNPKLDTRVLTEQYTYDPLNRINGSSAYYGATASTGNIYKTAYSYDPNGNILSLLRHNKAGDKIDELDYGYEKTDITGRYERNTNKLRNVLDAQSGTDGLPSGQKRSLAKGDNLDNYEYDEIGQLKKDEQEGIANIVWSVYNKPLEVNRVNGSLKENLKFAYDASGNRVLKTVTVGTSVTKTWYIRDAQGNTMAVYKEGGESNKALTLMEHHLYGSSRLGIAQRNIDMTAVPSTILVKTETTGDKNYELTDHLSNTRVVLSDRLVGGKADIVAAYDYYPFGLISQRFEKSGSEGKYLFNGMEKTDEIAAGHYTAEFWEYDSRIAHRWNIDPLFKKYPSQSPYATFNGNPILFADPTGESGIATIDKETKTITVESKFIFYGSKANTALSKVTADEISKQYNDANAKITIGGQEYSVKFKITYQTVTEAEAETMASTNSDAKVNFIRVEKNNESTGRSFNEIGDNSGFMNTDDKLGTSTTAPHEVGHGYGLLHSSGDQRGDGQPDIMAARGTLVDPEYQYDPKASPGKPGGTINPATRKVTQENITDIFKDVKFDKKGKGQIGKATNRIYNAKGYEKPKK